MSLTPNLSQTNGWWRKHGPETTPCVRPCDGRRAVQLYAPGALQRDRPTTARVVHATCGTRACRRRAGRAASPVVYSLGLQQVYCTAVQLWGLIWVCNVVTLNMKRDYMDGYEHLRLPEPRCSTHTPRTSHRSHSERRLESADRTNTQYLLSPAIWSWLAYPACPMQPLPSSFGESSLVWASLLRMLRSVVILHNNIPRHAGLRARRQIRDDRRQCQQKCVSASGWCAIRRALARMQAGGSKRVQCRTIDRMHGLCRSGT